MPLPAFIDFGVVISTPAPVVTTGGELLTLALQGDADKLDALVDRVLNAPGGTSSEYRAVGSTVLLQLGGMASITSGLAPYDTAGSARETQASFWIPVVAGKQVGGFFVASRFGIFSPYVLVDNPMSLVGGREVFGYPKSLARFFPADGTGDAVSLKVYGGNFGPTRVAAWHPFFDVEAVTPAAGATPGQLLSGAAAIAGAIWPGFTQALVDDDDLILPGFTFLPELLNNLAAGRSQQVFLKQFRDVRDSTRACYQEVVEVPVVMQKVDAQPTGRVWRLTVHPLDSHPLTAELGIGTQTTATAFHVDLDFTVELGVEVP